MDKTVAVLAADGFQDEELLYPLRRLQEAGATVHVVGRGADTVTSEHGYTVETDLSVTAADAGDYDAVVVPGGRACPDRLRTDDDVVAFVRDVYDNGDVVAAICHAGWVPVSAGIVDGHAMTCYRSIKDDVVNAGADYRDEAVVVSDNLVTSRHPGDLPQFLPAILDALRD